MREKNETMKVLFLLLKFSARLLIGAWLLRKYVEEKVFDDEERTSHDGLRHCRSEMEAGVCVE